MSLLQVENLTISFESPSGSFEAVRDVSFSIEQGTTLGLVGESGSGKSVTALALMGLLPARTTRIKADRLELCGIDLLSDGGRSVRGKLATMVFQDPMTSLNPYMRLDRQLMEPLRLHTNLSRSDARKRMLDTMTEVGIPDPESRIQSYPHEFSGGMRQRVMIAMAMLTRPELLIADEPTTALDVTVQRQILQLMQNLQRDHGTSILFISHDLGVVREISQRIVVMWKSRLVEELEAKQLFETAQHPYTQALLQCHPAFHPAGERLKTLDDLMADAGGTEP